MHQRQSTGLRSDQTVILTAIESAQAYPDSLRRVSYFDAATNKRLKFLTNNFALPALTIAEIYRSRWQVELFFRCIKHHLRIKKFYGTSENAVKTQICIAVSVYVLVAIVRKRLGLEASLYQILQILSVTLFEGGVKVGHLEEGSVSASRRPHRGDQAEEERLRERLLCWRRAHAGLDGIDRDAAATLCSYGRRSAGRCRTWRRCCGSSYSCTVR